ncbi:hypothetical protein [Hyphomicrobium sp. ghe19]|uniref:hypothetical protein n=1 Tax=Hyphomicrobium sp. ghe19 TaxID=2682968 RepID=UPI001366CA93|nr:hypothetical protein HYPP_01493 [Hyphomicrobium sp. ghe19]
MPAGSSPLDPAPRSEFWKLLLQVGILIMRGRYWLLQQQDQRGRVGTFAKRLVRADVQLVNWKFPTRQHEIWKFPTLCAKRCPPCIRGAGGLGKKANEVVEDYSGSERAEKYFKKYLLLADAFAHPSKFVEQCIMPVARIVEVSISRIHRRINSGKSS